jgi:hypothetical protein
MEPTSLFPDDNDASKYTHTSTFCEQSVNVKAGDTCRKDCALNR